MARKELKPSDLTAIIDNKEKTPWDLAPLKTIKGTLYTADYSLLGLTSEIALERKSLFDLLGVIGQHRERFEHELLRLKSFPVKAIIVEATFEEFSAARWLEKGIYPWQSRLKPEAAMGSVLSWIAQGFPIVFAGDASKASLCAARIMFIAAKQRWKQLNSFYDNLRISS